MKPVAAKFVPIHFNNRLCDGIKKYVKNNNSSNTYSLITISMNIRVEIDRWI